MTITGEKLIERLQKPSEFSIEQTISEKETKTSTYYLSVNPNKIAWSLGIITFVLVLVNIAVLAADHLTGNSSIVIHKLVKLFYLDLEQNIPSFFSMLLLLFASLLLMVIAILKQRQKAAYVFEWTILSLGFFYIAFDEILAIHDRLVEPLQAMLGQQQLGIFYFAWVIPALVLVFFLGIFFLRFLINLPRKYRFWFLVAGAMFVGGSIGVELYEGAIAEKYGFENFSYYTLVTIEETLEMLGVVVFNWALLKYIAENYQEIELRFCQNEEHTKNNLA